MTLKPRYTHDCDACTYLGQFEEADLYICLSGHPTIIARFSSDGPDYISGLVFAATAFELREAVALAYEKGLWYTPPPTEEDVENTVARSWRVIQT